LWVLGNIIAGVVFSGLILRNQPDTYYGSDGSQMLMISLAVLAQGLITGYVMLFLFEKKLMPMTPDGHEEIVAGPKSVWDEAI
jgi:hypothetical protein